MRPSPSLLLTLGLVALATPLASAEDPCAGDVLRLCPDVQSGSGRVVTCLREHQAQLSVSCQDRLAADALRERKTVERFGRACKADVASFCAGLRPGGGRILQCLAEHHAELSPACQGETSGHVQARERFLAVKQACTADADRLCQGVPARAAPLLECLKANEPQLSAGCSAAAIREAVEAGSLIDTIEEMSREDRVKEALEVLQGIDAVAFSRSQILFQFDSFNGVGGKANASRFLFNPQLVFGEQRQYSLQLKVPVLTLYPDAAGAPTQSGVGVVTTAFAWAFSFHGQVGQYLAVGLQSPVAGLPALGGPWTVAPSYALAMGLARWLSLTTQATWVRSVKDDGYPAMNILVLEPILVFKLPGRAFAVLDTRLAWNLENHVFVPLMKGVVGLFLDQQKSVSVSAWYLTSLTDAAVAQSLDYGFGVGLAHYFDW